VHSCIHVISSNSIFLDVAEMRDVAYVNNTGIIAQNPKMTAINSCIEIDLTGQVVSDSIGTRMYSGKTS
jgi:acyl-CoA hydrolase